MQLISKIQYKISEKGEFHEIQERDIEDTIAFIINYPWDIERSLASVELTCPSVTIEHPAGTYLKIGPYFSGKYSVYYLANNKVYLKIANTLEDACVWVKEYFERKGKIVGFDKYGFTLNAVAHFRTNPFEYTVNTTSTAKIFWLAIFMTILMSLACLMTLIERPENFNIGMPITFTIIILIMTGPTIYLFFNYLKADSNHYLQISRGHDDFKFGTFDDKKIYRKQDIMTIERYKTNDRSPWAECELFIITFQNGVQIKFSSLLILGNTLRSKFPQNPVTEVETFFPTIER